MTAPEGPSAPVRTVLEHPNWATPPQVVKAALEELVRRGDYELLPGPDPRTQPVVRHRDADPPADAWLAAVDALLRRAGVPSFLADPVPLQDVACALGRDEAVLDLARDIRRELLAAGLLAPKPRRHVRWVWRPARYDRTPAGDDALAVAAATPQAGSALPASRWDPFAFHATFDRGYDRGERTAPR